MSADSSDEQLVAAYRDGQPQALEQLIGRYRHELLGFLTRLLGNRAAAEDAFQETFLQVHLSADAFDVSRRFKPWLFTIAANKGRDHYRKHGRQSKMVDLSAPLRGRSSQSQTGAGTTLGDLLQAELPGLDSAMSADETREQVRQVVDSMPHHLREILLLAYFQRFSYNQIADSLGIPLGTVKSRLHSAVANFADSWRQMNGSMMDDDDDDGGGSGN